jgi:GNAT superfamily N-acetyltransferase
MPLSSDVTIRTLNRADVPVVASLHARSWRTAYRGILTDAYLDDDLESERQSVWTAKLEADDAGPGWLAIVDDEHVGFVYVRPREDARWGTLVDNLHVLATHQGLGIGRRLLHTVGTWAAEHAPGHPLHLWVFADNHSAREFYRRMGGTEVEFVDREASDGRALPEYRVAWTSPTVLIAATTPSR